MSTLTSIFNKKNINLAPGNYYRITVDSAGTIISGNQSLSLTDISDININSISVGQSLQWNGTKWVNATISSAGNTSLSLSGLTIDVSINTPTNGQVLQYNSSTSKWANNNLTLSSLSNVSISSPVSGQVLKYNGTAWVNGTDNVGSGGSTSLSALTDVQISTLSTNQVLQWNGTKWVNATISTGSGSTNLAGLTDVTITSATTNQVLQYNGSRWVNATISTGGGSSLVTPYEITCTDWAAGNFTAPSGWTVTKVNSDTALQVSHNLGKVPVVWSGVNLLSSPNLAIVPSSTRNMQIDTSNQVTFLQVGALGSFKLHLLFT